MSDTKVLSLKPLEFAHIEDMLTNITHVERGPCVIKLLEHQHIVFGPAPYVIIPPGKSIYRFRTFLIKGTVILLWGIPARSVFLRKAQNFETPYFFGVNFETPYFFPYKFDTPYFTKKFQTPYFFHINLTPLISLKISLVRAF